MKPADRIIASRHDARGALVVILLVALARLVLERVLLSDLGAASHLPPLNLVMPLSNALFYGGCFWLFCVLFSLLLSRPYGEVANAICVGLVFGVLPPLLDLYLPGGQRMPFRWYSALRWTLAEKGQPLAETVTLWLLFAGAAAWVYYYTRSPVRAALGFLGSYLIIQLFTVVVLVTGPSGHHLFGLLALPVLCWFALRARVLVRCLLRLHHGLPHGALALLGAAWCGQPLATGIVRALVMIAGVFVLLVHNDHYDRREDELAGRAATSSGDDVIWSTAFYIALLLCFAPNQPLLALLGLSFLLFGFLYHHPSLRLKERFCLSYMVEGAWALIAFMAGAAAGSDVMPGARLAVAGTAIFGGGALLSMPKDWKDVASDRAARIPTIYVLLTRGGRSERAVHRMVVAAATIGLLLPPVWLLLAVRGGLHSTPGALAAIPVAFVPGALLLLIANRGKALDATLYALTGYLLLLAVAIGLNPSPRVASPRPDAPGPVKAALVASEREPALDRLFAPFHVEAIEGAPRDFGRIRRAPAPSGAAGPRYQVSPRSAEELSAIVTLAYAHHVPLRIRGQGHSMNGSTLPSSGELLVRTRGLTAIRFDKPGTVTAEAGIPIQDLRQLLRNRFGYDLPVSNGGGGVGGPSIGGFINAGGFGMGSAEYGGFWENVDAVTLLVAGGQRMTVERSSPDFGWLFGAMGQLGVVLEARLDLIPVDVAHPRPYPEGQHLSVEAPPTDASSMTPIYWYTLFVSGEEKDAAARALAEIQARHATELSFRPPYSYSIRHRRITAPLVYGRSGDFFAIGIWGDGPGAATVDTIDREVAELARKANYRRYVQAEVLAGSESYRDYFGQSTWQDLFRRRQAIDPQGLFNRGTVFEE